MLALELLHDYGAAVDEMLGTEREDLLHRFCGGHLDEPERTWALSSRAWRVAVLPHSRVCGEHPDDLSLRRKVLLERTASMEAELVDAAHDEETTLVFVTKDLQTR